MRSPSQALVPLIVILVVSGCECDDRSPEWPVEPAPGIVQVVEAAQPEGGSQSTFGTSDLSVPPREGDVGWWVDLALDSAGRPHLAYTDAFEGELHYAEPRASGWAVRVVDQAGAVGKYPALAVDHEDRPHLLYYNQDKRRLLYATYVGPERVDPEDRRRPHLAAEGWLYEIVDEGEEIGMASTLAVDPDGTVHAFYYDAQERLFHSWRPPTALGEHRRWQRRTVDPRAGGSHSIFIGHALAPDGTRFLSYAHYTLFDATLRLARLAPGSEAWEVEEITGEGNAGWKSGVVVQDDGRPVVAYLALETRQIRLAWPTREGWQTAPVAEAGNSLVFTRGRDGRVLLAYEHLPGASLAGATPRYLTRPGLGGDLAEGWTLHPLPRARMSGYLAAVLGPEGPVLAWYDGTVRGVRLYSEPASTPERVPDPEAPATPGAADAP